MCPGVGRMEQQTMSHTVGAGGRGVGVRVLVQTLTEQSGPIQGRANQASLRRGLSGWLPAEPRWEEEEVPQPGLGADQSLILKVPP